MAETFTPLLTTTDWNEEWKQLQVARKRADDAAYWDDKAKTFPVKHGSQAGYVEQFLKLAAIQPGETVLDMGCGTGALATPLAKWEATSSHATSRVECSTRCCRTKQNSVLMASMSDR